MINGFLDASFSVWRTLKGGDEGSCFFCLFLFLFLFCFCFCFCFVFVFVFVEAQKKTILLVYWLEFKNKW